MQKYFITLTVYHKYKTICCHVKFAEFKNGDQSYLQKKVSGIVFSIAHHETTPRWVQDEYLNH